jgi:hypothetical protein
MFRKIFGKRSKELKVESIDNVPWEPIEVPRKVKVPEKAVKNIDQRLIVKTGKKGKTVFMKTPCVIECAGCDKQFDPTPPEGGKSFCKVYSDPRAMWAGLNHKGEPKTCLGVCKPKAEKEETKPKKLNPLKASKREAKQTPITDVSGATSSKESRKKNKKKKERRDSR